MRTIKKVIVHCSDSDDSLDVGRREIDEWHRQRGFLSETGVSIGYHFVIRRNGVIEVGRTVDEVGAHAKGYNSNSIGICVIGRKNFSEKQKSELYKLVRSLMTQYRVDISDVLGHYELDSHKTCPNMDMNRVRGEILFTKED